MGHGDPAGGLPGAAAFSLADPTVITDLLKATGFGAIAFTDVHEPVFYGPTVDAAYEAIVGLFVGKDAPAGVEAARTLQRLRALVEAHLTQDGVWFDSRAWIVTAHKAA